MNRTVNKHGATYEAVIEEQAESTKPSTCHTRSDDSGIWNVCKAWHLFLVHLLASIALMVGIIRIDRHKFEIGAGPTIFAHGSELYQAQVTGLISLGLVIIRLIAGSCSALLAWRIVFVLLEKRGITLAELARLTNFRFPILPTRSSGASLLWAIWATAAILLLWPQGFAAPLASSSVSWIPGIRVLQKSESTSVATVGRFANWAAVLYPDARMSAVVGAAAMTAKDPAYAFHPSQIPLRRYFNSSQMIPDGSKIDITVPYFAVNLRWIDASSDNRSQNAGSTTYQDVDQDFSIRTVGATGIVRDEPWNGETAMPSNATIFVGNKLVAVKLRTLNFGDALPDGSRANSSTQCLTVSDVFGQLPNVSQHQSPIGNGQEIVAYDCYMVAEATITAGSVPGTDCTVASSAGSAELYTTCSIRRDDDAVEEHWLTDLALDFTSEVLKYSVLQNYTQPWISSNLDDYTSGLLTLGYHGAWSGLMMTLGNASEPTAFRAASPIVSASVDSTKLCIWLAMNATLTASAVLVLLAQRVSKTKTIRDTAVAALTMDLTEVTHSSRTNGLCNAVALSKQDGKLPRLKWKEEGAGAGTGETSMYESCCRKVLFVDEAAYGLRRRR
jgi:hypothetical protein